MYIVHFVPERRGEEQMERQYNVVWVRDDKGTRGVMNAKPMTHAEALVFKSKLTDYPWRRLMLEEA